jgi:hypothetical protein
MTTDDWHGLILSAISGGLLGWASHQAVTIWRNRPVLRYDRRSGRWRRPWTGS